MSVENQMQRWGDYMQTSRDFGLGFPKRTVLHRCMVEGPAAGSPTGHIDEPIPADVEAVEAALNGVPDRDKRLALALYVERKPVPMLRRVLGVNRDMLDDMIARMHTRVEEALHERGAAA